MNLNTPIRSGGNVGVLGNAITVGRQVDAAGTITFTIDDKGTATDGRVAINGALNSGAGPATFTGGTGTGDTVDFSGFVGTPVTVSAGRMPGIETLIGPPGTNDILEGSATGDVFTITGPNSGTVVSGASDTLAFSFFENLRSLGGDDQFTFLNQATVDGWINGGSGSDTLRIDDSTFPNGGVYNIRPNLITRNPSYSHSNFEYLHLLAGSGDDTVNSSFLTGISQYLDGGSGSNDTLNLTGATFPGANPIYGPAGTGHVHYYGFESFPPPPPPPIPGEGDQVLPEPLLLPVAIAVLRILQDAIQDSGGLLQIQLDHSLPQIGPDAGAGPRGFDVINNFNSGPVVGADVGASGMGPGVPGASGLGLLQASSPAGTGTGAQVVTAGQGNAVFSAAPVGVATDPNQGAVIFAISLDGSGALPSQFVEALILQNLGIPARSELSLALGGPGEAPVTLFDGPVALNASGAAPPPVVVGSIGLNLSPSAQSELSLALGGNGAAPLDAGQGVQAILLDGVPPGPAVVALFGVNLGPQTRSELSLALGGPGEIPLGAGTPPLSIDGAGAPPPANVVVLFGVLLNDSAMQELQSALR